MSNRGILASLQNFTKEHIPSNMRLFASTMLGNTNSVDESYFPEKDLEAFRNAVRSAEGYRQKQQSHYQDALAAYGSVPADKAISYQISPETGEAVPGTQVFAGDRVQENQQSLDRLNNQSPSIGYDDYGSGVAERLNQPGFLRELQDSFTDPNYRAATTVGHANYTQDAQGNTVLHDTYDWNYGEELREKSVQEQLKLLAEAIGRGPKAMGNLLGNYLAPEGSKRARDVQINLGKVE